MGYIACCAFKICLLSDHVIEESAEILCTVTNATANRSVTHFDRNQKQKNRKLFSLFLTKFH